MTQVPYKPYPDHYDYIRDSDGHAIKTKEIIVLGSLGGTHRTTFELDASRLYDPGPRTRGGDRDE